MVDDIEEGRKGIDWKDPTANVRELVLQESKYQDAMRDALKELINEKTDHTKDMLTLISANIAAYQNSQRDAETRRIDELAETRQEFQNTIRDMLAESVRTTSTLVSTQLVQIQATFDTRVSKLEAGAFTQAGKSSVADPQLADFMRMMSQSIQSMGAASSDLATKMTSQQADATAKLTLAISAIGAKEMGGDARRMGQGQVIAWIVAGFMLIAAIASPIISYMAMRGSGTGAPPQVLYSAPLPGPKS
jgi:hypothetical protein